MITIGRIRRVTPRRLRNALILRLAHATGRSRVAVLGAWGRVLGHSDDRVMLGHYARHGTWSVAVVDLIRREMRARPQRRWHLVDVGAAVGLVTVGILRGVDATADLFEPDPETFALLTANIASLGLDGAVRAHFCALGDPARTGDRVRMARTPGNGGDSRMRPAPDDPAATPLRRLDDMIAPDAAASLVVKIDVQGAEPDIIAGGQATLARAELVVIEFWPYGLRAQGHAPEALIERLVSWPGLAAMMVDEHRPQRVVWTAPERLRQLLAALAASDDPAAQAEVILKAASGSADPITGM